MKKYNIVLDCLDYRIFPSLLWTEEIHLIYCKCYTSLWYVLVEWLVYFAYAVRRHGRNEFIMNLFRRNYAASFTFCCCSWNRSPTSRFETCPLFLADEPEGPSHLRKFAFPASDGSNKLFHQMPDAGG